MVLRAPSATAHDGTSGRWRCWTSLEHADFLPTCPSQDIPRQVTRLLCLFHLVAPNDTRCVEHVVYEAALPDGVQVEPRNAGDGARVDALPNNACSHLRLVTHEPFPQHLGQQGICATRAPKFQVPDIPHVGFRDGEQRCLDPIIAFVSLRLVHESHAAQMMPGRIGATLWAHTRRLLAADIAGQIAEALGRGARRAGHVELEITEAAQAREFSILFRRCCGGRGGRGRCYGHCGCGRGRPRGSGGGRSRGRLSYRGRRALEEVENVADIELLFQQSCTAVLPSDIWHPSSNYSRGDGCRCATRSQAHHLNDS